MSETGLQAAPRLVWGVSALLLAAGDALSSRFGACTVRGEVTGFSRAGSGHCYFSLKDVDGAAASLRCAMFRRAASMATFALRDGQQVEVRGRIAVYEARGELQFVVESIQRVGAGTLYEQFLQLKARLEAQGMFAQARKRPLTRWPKAVGVITSLKAAALLDVLTALQRRAPQVRVIVYPSVVQGVEAPAALVSSLAVAARRAEVETLILCRGGGSLEDLWAFNDERVVRAIVASPIPVVCGVGHETDVSLADFAADLRAATPTAAAELAAPARDEALATLAASAARLRRQLRGRLDAHAQRLDHAAAELARPAHLVLRHAMTLRHLDGRRRSALANALRQAQQGPLAAAAQLRRGATLQTARAHARLDALGQRLAALDPKRVLARGYAWVTDERGQPIVSVRALRVGQAVHAVWADGSAGAHVLDVHPDP